MAVSHSSRLERPGMKIPLVYVAVSKTDCSSFFLACVPFLYCSTGESVALPPQNIPPHSRGSVGNGDESPALLRPSERALRSSPKKTRSLSHLRDPDHVKRPENAFMLFRKSRVGLYNNTGAPQRQASISKLVSSEWNKLTCEAKAPWHDLAKYVAAEHRRRYPDYQYRPKRRKNLKEKCYRGQKGTPPLPASPTNASTSRTILAPPVISLPTELPIPTIDRSFKAAHHSTDPTVTSRRGRFPPHGSTTATRNTATATTTTTTTTTTTSTTTSTATMSVQKIAATAFDREPSGDGSATEPPSFDTAKAVPADIVAAPSDKTSTLLTGEGSHNVMCHMPSVSTAWDMPYTLLADDFLCDVHTPSEPLAPPPNYPLDL